MKPVPGLLVIFVIVGQPPAATGGDGPLRVPTRDTSAIGALVVWHETRFAAANGLATGPMRPEAMAPEVTRPEAMALGEARP